MMKVLLFLGLFALAGARWVPDYRPLESISEREHTEEDSQMQDIDRVKFQFNIHGLGGDVAFGADNYTADNLEDQVEALQTSDAPLGRQADLAGDGEEIQEVLARGRLVSSQSDDPEESRFMDVPADRQAVEDPEESIFMDVPADRQAVEDPEESRFMDVPADRQAVDDPEESRFMDVLADRKTGDNPEESRLMGVLADRQNVDDSEESRYMDVPDDAQPVDE